MGVSPGPRHLRLIRSCHEAADDPQIFLLVPKKNGKSSIAAAIMVTAAILNMRPEAELLLIAPTKKIADIAFKQAKGIIRLDPDLTKIFHSQEHQKTLRIASPLP